MGAHELGNVRNVALVGHAGSGKTSLGEVLLHKVGATTRLGSVDDHTSHLDYDEESKERGHSVDSSASNGLRFTTTTTRSPVTGSIFE